MKIEFEIPDLVLQKQPTDKTCVHTCIAMSLGIPVAKVIEKYGDSPMNQIELIKVLEECGMIWNQFCFNTLVFQGVTSLSFHKNSGKYSSSLILFD